MKKPVIICVDDEKIILDSLEQQILNRLGNEYDCELAEGGEEGLEIIEDLLREGRSIAVIISDQLMPGMKGDEFLIRAHSILPETQKILLTGQASFESVKNAINKARLYRYINKPWEENDLMLTVEEAGRSFMNQIQLIEYNRMLRTLNKATQEISGEIDYNRLVTRLMQNVIDTIHAEQGFLVFLRDELLVVEAFAAKSNKDLQALQSSAQTDFDSFNETITKRIYATLENSQTAPFSFVAPISKKGYTLGYLFLENRYSKTSFSSHQKEIIQMLASQAAISIENSHLISNIEERTKELEIEKIKVDKSILIIEEKNNDIMDSIRYAKRIQEAIMPEKEYLQYFFNDSFVWYKPKDIVSGDFYWFVEKYHKFFIAAVDCTGHGVPGAFMSVIGSNLLNQIVNEFSVLEPETVLEHLNFRVKSALKQDQENSENNDGMDIAFVSIDIESNLLQFSGANRPLWIIRNGEVLDYKPSKVPIGGAQYSDKAVNFIGYSIVLEDNDCIYIFTDGIPDQFGGVAMNGLPAKKFSTRRLQEMLLEIHTFPMEKQVEIIQKEVEKWKGDEEQTDDNLIIGIRFKVSK